MALNSKDLQKLIRFLQKNGVSRFKNAEIEIELSPSLAPRQRQRAGSGANPTEPAADKDGWDSLTAEQKLLWSSPSMNEEPDANH